MNRRKSELDSVLKRVKNASSLTEISELQSETFKVLIDNQQEGQIAKEEALILVEISGVGNFKIFDFINRWNNGKINPKKEDTEYLKKFYTELPQRIEIIEKALKFAEESGENEDQDLWQANKLNEEIMKKFKEYQILLPKLFKREDRKAQLEVIIQELKNSLIPLTEMKKNSKKVKEIFTGVKNEEISSYEALLSAEIELRLYISIEDWVRRWAKKTFHPNNEELEILKEIDARLPEAIQDLKIRAQEEKKLNRGNDYLAFAELFEKESENLLNSHELLRKCFERERLEQEIRFYGNKSKDGKSKQSLSDEFNKNDFEQTRKKIDHLNIEIKNLENKLLNSSFGQSGRQKQLNNLQNKKISNNTQPSNKNYGFSWLYVVIPLGILILILGMVVAYLLGKKNKRE